MYLARPVKVTFEQENFLYFLWTIPRFTMSDEENEKMQSPKKEAPELEVERSDVSLTEEQKEAKVEEAPNTEGEEKKEGALGEEEAVKPGEETPEEEEEPKKRIIIVDSQEKSLDEAISALRKGEYTVVGVESAKEFFEVTSQERVQKDDSNLKAINPEEFWELTKGNVPDVLITDLDIKDQYGWEFIFTLKFDNRYYEYRDIPILVRSDEPITIETVKKIQAESIHDYIPKSVKGEALLEKVDKYFETREKLSEKKKEIAEAMGYRAANEYERIALAIRIRLKYLGGLKTKLEDLKKEEGDSSEIKQIQDVFYLQNRELIKYERRKREINKLLKEKKVKEDDGGAGTQPGTEIETD
jgi:CheY-like chemotaxis protein